MTPSIFALVLFAFAGGASLEGRIVTPGGEPAPQVRVLLVELHRTVFTDDDGRYAFVDLEPADYHVQAVSPGLGSGVAEISVVAGINRLNLELSISPHQEQIVVSATRSGRGSSELVQPVTVLDKVELAGKMQSTIGETLAQEPGMSQTFFGSGASRPVIRGQSSSRVRVLEGGLGVGDASATSPDHAVASDALVADQIEILRGPSTLLYGSTAVGGVVNVIDSRIPDHAPNRPLGGSMHVSQGTVADETAAAVALDGGFNQFAWHIDTLNRDAGDYSSGDGRLPNSAREATGATLGMSWVGDGSYVGVSARRFNTLYGIPVELEPGSPIEIDLEQTRYDLRGDFHVDWGFIEEVQFTAGSNDYEHKELEGSEIGTRFLVDSSEGRLEFHHRETDALTGIIGVQLSDKDQVAIGEEAFLPPSETSQRAIFALERLDGGAVDLEFGLRFENTELKATANPDRRFDGLSASFGLLWPPNDGFALGFSIARAERAPTAEELYSDGAHLATFSYEVGDPTLELETSLGIDLSLRKRTGRLTGELTLFANRYDGYVFESPTGQVIDTLPVFQFSQADAEFYGLELDLLIELMEARSKHDLDLRLFGDMVRAELTDTGIPLPFIPASRVGLGLQYTDGSWDGEFQILRTSDQDRVPGFITTTDGFTSIDVSVGRRIIHDGLVHKLTLRGSNLTDELARAATSRVKDLVPLPGRDVRLTYTLFF
ncbi:MAG: TonB-dependent receptor [Acidobacteriota bacterium]|nr:TonB-dependent receptor [Acidobacteriota bacterium]MDH3785995.1 TonB-dependent receptor [Acidobacteriota bacterium]